MVDWNLVNRFLQGERVNLAKGGEPLPEADEDMVFAEKRVRVLSDKVVRLRERKERMEFLGANPNSVKWRGLLYDIEMAERELKYWRQKLLHPSQF